MANDQTKGTPSEKERRAQRLAEALRANLHRRKAQSRGRKSTAEDSSATPRQDQGGDQDG